MHNIFQLGAMRNVWVLIVLIGESNPHGQTQRQSDQNREKEGKARGPRVSTPDCPALCFPSKQHPNTPACQPTHF